MIRKIPTCGSSLPGQIPSVINGILTETVATGNPDAVLAIVEDAEDHDAIEVR